MPSSYFGGSFSPLFNTDRKGGSYLALIQNFCWVPSVSVVHGHTQHKFVRLHYVRATADKAKQTCRADYSKINTEPCEVTLSWFYEQMSEDYDTFFRYLNGYDLNMPHF